MLTDAASSGQNEHPASCWRQTYDTAALQLPELAARSKPVMLGFSAFVDATVRLHEARAIFADDAPLPIKRLARQLLDRIAHRSGGEIEMLWEDGDTWLGENLEHVTRGGGTSLQIANVLSIVGAPSLLALSDRSANQLAVIEQGVKIATEGDLSPPTSIHAVSDGAKARHWIFEATAGTTVATIPVQRSTRIIVRLANDGPERDRHFEVSSQIMASAAGAAAISSLVATPEDIFDDALVYVKNLASGWRKKGLGLIHLEMADYGANGGRPAKLLSALHGSVNSVGMSLSEWNTIGDGNGGDLIGSMRVFATRYGLERLCIHADDWAASVTRRDPVMERQALIYGCLLASARAAAGQPVIPGPCPQDATFNGKSGDYDAGDGWSAVLCPSPFQPTPRSTIGLGDTFVAGCLLVLSQT